MSAPHFDVHERRGRLARRHHLLPSQPGTDIAAVAERMVGLHASDPATVRAGATKGASHVVFELFDDVGRTASQAVAQRATQLETWLAGTVVTTRFPTPTDRRLRGMAQPSSDVSSATSCLKACCMSKGLLHV